MKTANGMMLESGMQKSTRQIQSEVVQCIPILFLLFKFKLCSDLTDLPWDLIFETP